MLHEGRKVAIWNRFKFFKEIQKPHVLQFFYLLGCFLLQQLHLSYSSKSALLTVTRGFSIINPVHFEYAPHMEYDITMFHHIE